MRGLVFSIDDAYVMPFKVLWNSLIKTDSIPSKTPIFMLHEATLSAKSIDDLKLFSEKYGRSISFLNTQRFVPNDLPISHHISKASYYRLYISSILPSNISSVVYLDADAVAVRSIRDLFEFKMNLPLAATDHMSPQDAFRLFGERSGNYFQGGVLLIDLDIWRSEKVEQRFTKILREEKNRILWWDQDILNIAFEGRWQRLPLWFNVCNHVRKAIDMKVIESNARFVHLDGSGKPWKFYSSEIHAKQWYLAYENCFGKPFDRKLIIKPLCERIFIAIKRIIKFITKEIKTI
jgi:lipopolysaccharide biosynthesis glycosyltransferase